MGAKKKKGKKKAAKAKKEDGDDEPKEENPAFTVNLPQYGWIRLTLILCDSPTPKFNEFKVVLRSSDRVLELKKVIADRHGRVDNVRFYNVDPYPPRNKKDNFRMTQKPRVPPFRLLPKLLALQKQQEEHEAMLKKKAEREAEGESDEEPKGPYNPYGTQEEDPRRFDVIKEFDYPKTEADQFFVEYDEKDISLFEIFNEYGTAARPKLDPKDDPPQPPPKEKKKPPTPPPKEEPKEEEEGKEEGDGLEDAKIEMTPKEEEEEEEVWIPPVDRTLYYDFKAHDAKAPILLALMKKGVKDEFTL